MTYRRENGLEVSVGVCASDVAAARGHPAQSPTLTARDHAFVVAIVAAERGCGRKALQEAATDHYSCVAKVGRGRKPHHHRPHRRRPLPPLPPPHCSPSHLPAASHAGGHSAYPAYAPQHHAPPAALANALYVQQLVVRVRTTSGTAAGLAQQAATVRGLRALKFGAAVARKHFAAGRM